jgi:hypothetical protein
MTEPPAKKTRGPYNKAPKEEEGCTWLSRNCQVDIDSLDLSERPVSSSQTAQDSVQEKADVVMDAARELEDLKQRMAQIEAANAAVNLEHKKVTLLRGKDARYDNFLSLLQTIDYINDNRMARLTHEYDVVKLELNKKETLLREKDETIAVDRSLVKSMLDFSQRRMDRLKTAYDAVKLELNETETLLRGKDEKIAALESCIAAYFRERPTVPSGEASSICGL